MVAICIRGFEKANLALGKEMSSLSLVADRSSNDVAPSRSGILLKSLRLSAGAPAFLRTRK